MLKFEFFLVLGCLLIFKTTQAQQQNVSMVTSYGQFNETVAAGTTNKIIYDLRVTVWNTNVTLIGVEFPLSGTYITTDIDSFSLSYFDGVDATPVLKKQISVASGTSIIFNNLDITPTLVATMDYNIFLSANISPNAINGHTIFEEEVRPSRTVILHFSDSTSAMGTNDTTVVDGPTYTFSNTTALSENINYNGAIFPNPSAGDLKVRTHNTVTEVNVFNYLGQLLHTQLINNESEKINLNFLYTGIYNVVVKNVYGIHNYKWIKN